MRYVLDTSAYSQLVRGDAGVAEVVTTATEIILPFAVVVELKYGFCFGTKRAENESLLNKFIYNRRVRVVFPDYATIDYFVTISVTARRKGIQLSTHDLWIAALAEQFNATLVSFDKDFQHLSYENLRLWNG